MFETAVNGLFNNLPRKVLIVIETLSCFLKPYILFSFEFLSQFEPAVIKYLIIIIILIFIFFLSLIKAFIVISIILSFYAVFTFKLFGQFILVCLSLLIRWHVNSIGHVNVLLYLVICWVSIDKTSEKYFFRFFSPKWNRVVKYFSIKLLFNSSDIHQWNLKLSFLSKKGLVVKVRVEAQPLSC